MGRVVALMDDLFFQMKVAETAKHLGVEFKVAANGDVLATMLEPPTTLVIVDLNAKSEPVATIARLRATHKELPIVAFLSHVQTGPCGAGESQRFDGGPAAVGVHAKSGQDSGSSEGLRGIR